jgi:hypothetical protein
MNNKKKYKPHTVSFNDEDRTITLTYANGKISKFKAKPRKVITEENLLNDKVVMAIFEYGVLRNPTELEIMEHKIWRVKRAKELNII